MSARRAMAVLLLAAGCAASDAAELTPALAIRTATAQRTPEGGLAFTLQFGAAPDLAHVRILLDTDGTKAGEPGTGAEYMMEGPHFFRYPPGAPAWTWNEVNPPVQLLQSNGLTCLLPIIPALTTFRWVAETTRPDWTTADRYPGKDSATARFAQLPVLDPESIARAAADPHLDLLRAEAFRLEPNGVALTLTFADTPDIARVRLLLDVDGPARGEAASGADYLVEGAMFYAYPPEGKGWTWNALEPALWLQESNTLTCLLFNLPIKDTLRWVAETTTADWQSADRIPVMGARDVRPAQLALLPPVSRPQPVDVSALLAQLGPALSERFEDELSTQEWTRANQVVPPSWPSPLFVAPPPVRMFLTDAVTGQRAEMKPAVQFAAEHRQRWGGRTLGVDWVLLADTDTEGTLELTGQLKAVEPRCVSVAVGIETDLAGWTWHDDVHFRRVMDLHSGASANVGSLSFGRQGEQSLYLFGVISTDQAALALETDPDEPRVYQISADPAQRFFGISYDLGLSPQTLKFPGRASFHCTVRATPRGGPDAFRHALADFYARHPDFQKRRSPEVGLWMPFFDISTLPSPDDFGFAFLEKEGALGSDVDYAESHGVLTLYYTEPWLYWLPMPPGMPRAPEQALAWARTLATTGNGRKNELAASALVSATRATNGAPALSFIDTPWNNGARMEVSTDPELPTTADAAVNRAMVEWKSVAAALADPRVDGIYLDSMQAMQVVDYNPASFAVADYPLVYAPGGTQPGVAMPVSAYEYTSALGRYLHDQQRLLMGNFPCWRWPFFMPFIDIPGEETSWLNGGAYAPMDEHQLNARRALSGHKPWGFLQAVDFTIFDATMAQRYFRDCLFWGFLPSFFSADGANEPYWLDSKLIERDRPQFKTFVPLIRRLAATGWEPLGLYTVDNPEVWIEHYGTAEAPVRHLTIRHSASVPTRAALQVPRQAEEQLVVDPLSGAYDIVPAGTGTARVEMVLSPDTVATRDVFALSALDQELAFARGWSSGGRESEALATSLASLRAERALGAFCAVRLPSPVLRSRDAAVSLVISNSGEHALVVSNVLFIGRSGPQPLRREPLSLAPGDAATVDGFIDGRSLPEEAWLEFQWNLRAGGTAVVSRRIVRPLVTQPVFATLRTTNVVSVEAVAGLDIDLYNFADGPRTVTAQARGDFDVEHTELTLGAGERRALQLEIPSGDRANGRLQVRASADGQIVLDAGAQVTFLGDNANMGRDSRVGLDVDSTYGGYTTRALVDGVTDTSGLAWNEAAWASEETASPHWVRLRFPQPTAVSEVRIVWNNEGGVRYASQRGVIRAQTYDGRQIDLGGFTNRVPSDATTVTFEPVQVQSIELVQPPGAGSPGRPNLLWLSEIEVR